LLSIFENPPAYKEAILFLFASFLVRNIPLAIICSMVAVTVFYVLVNVAYYTMMTPAELLLSDAVAVVSAGEYYTIKR